MISEYNQRQLHKMLDQIQSFEDKKISLGSLVGDLDFLLSALELSGEISWKQEVDREIGVMEEIYADALDKKAIQLEHKSETLILRSLKNIKEKLEEFL